MQSVAVNQILLTYYVCGVHSSALSQITTKLIIFCQLIFDIVNIH